MWLLAIVLMFLGWSSYVLQQYSTYVKAMGRKKVVEERLRGEGLMAKHFRNSAEMFTFQGNLIALSATLRDKKINVRVHGTVNLEYTYGIMDDESLVLIDTEE